MTEQRDPDAIRLAELLEADMHAQQAATIELTQLICSELVRLKIPPRSAPVVLGRILGHMIATTQPRDGRPPALAIAKASIEAQLDASARLADNVQ